MDPFETFTEQLDAARSAHPSPLLVALDGRSGTGKTTLSRQVAARMGAGVILGDDFYSGGTSEFWHAQSAQEKVRRVIDWRRQRTVLETLKGGGRAEWHPYDWEADNGQLADTLLTCDPESIVILDGAYSARPELADLLSLRVLLEAEADVRRARLVGRGGEEYHHDWESSWSVAEELYFGTIMPPEAFDLVLQTD